MADMSYMPYAQRAAEIERQRKLAELLQQQYAEPIQQQTAGGFVVPISPWQTVAKLAQAGLGAYMQGKSDKAAAKLDEEQRKEAKEQIESYLKGFGPQKVTTQTPVMEQDFGQAATPEDYQNMMNDPQMGLAPKRRDVSQAATPEDVQNIVNQPYEMKDVISYTPGMNRTQALAKLLEMKTGGNKYLSDATSVLAGALPKEVDASDLFNKLDMSKLTPESVQEVLKTGDIGKAKFAEDTMTPYQKAELDLRQKEANVRAAEAAVDNARSDAQLANSQAQLALAIQSRDQSKREFEYNYPNLAGQYTPAPVSTVQPPSGMTAPQPAGQQPVQQVTQPVSKPLSRQDQMAYNKDVATLTTAAGKLQAYRDALNKIGKSESLWGAGAGTLDTAYANALSAVRTLQNTGVFNPGEAPLLEKALADARTLKNIADPKARERILAQLDAQFEVLNTNKAAFDQQYQQEPKPLFTIGSKSTGETAAQRAKRLGL